MMKTTKPFLLFAFCLLLYSANAQSKKTIYIADRVAVTDSADCLQIKTKMKSEWKNIADTIAGLRYEEGFDYKAIVIVNKNQYKLLKLIWRKKTAYNPAERLQGSKWILRSMFDNNQTLRFSLQLHGAVDSPSRSVHEPALPEFRSWRVSRRRGPVGSGQPQRDSGLFP